MRWFSVSIEPRELNQPGPLGAGFLWLVFTALVTNRYIAHAHGNIGELRNACERLPPSVLAALGGLFLLLASFLVGSMSVSIFAGLWEPLADCQWIAESRWLCDRRARRRKQIYMRGEAASCREIQREEASFLALCERRDICTALLPPFVVAAPYLSAGGQSSWTIGPLVSTLLMVGVWWMIVVCKEADRLVAELTVSMPHWD